MSFNGARIVEGTVLKSSPTTHSVTVELDIPTHCGPIDCAILMQHGSSSGDAHLLSMPSTGQRVIALLDSDHQNGIIIGTLPKFSLGSEPSLRDTQYDPLSGLSRDVNYRGEDYADIYPGDLSLRSKSSRLLLSDEDVVVSSGEATLELSSVMGGYSSLHTQADTVSHTNSLFRYGVRDAGGDTLPAFELSAHTQTRRVNSLASNSYGSETADTTIRMSQDTPLDIQYGSKASIAIDSLGRLLLRGNSVTIETDGQVHEFGKGSSLNTVHTSPVTLGSEQSLTIGVGSGEEFSEVVKSPGSVNIIGRSVNLSSDNATSLASSNGTLSLLAGGVPKSIPIPGKDSVMNIAAPNGGIAIRAGSSVLGPGSITKPGVRIQSEGGGDIHISSALSLGGAFTTGTVVIDSAVPVSSAQSGGTGGYGIVLNSPLIQLGGLPGVADTPEGIPGPFSAPVPPVYDSYVKHYSFTTIYNVALMASVTAGLTAAFPPTATASVAAFTGAFSTALASMSTPPVGRPLSIVGIG